MSASETATAPRTSEPASPDLSAIKTKQQATWASGDYAVIGTTLQIVGETLAEAIDLRAGERVLDVAAGNGNASLAAARRFAEVTATDYVPALLERAKARADAEGLTLTFRVADAEALPFADASFDVVLSTFGVMFTPDQARAAREMLRVTREGGRIGLANWTPEGFIGQLFKIVGAYLPPPAGINPAVRWGTEPHIVSLFGPQAADIQCTRRHFNFRYRSSAHWIQMFRDFYGPVFKTFTALDTVKRAALERDITDLLERSNRGGDDSLVVPGEYLEVIVVKR
jgi:SAM-dependent methyltransferase